MPAIHSAIFGALAAGESVIPKRLRDYVYRQMISSLTRHNIRLTKPEDIFQTVPIACDPSSKFRVWIVSSSSDMTMATWCLKTLLHFSKCRWDVWLADAGDLSGEQRATLERHFPGIRILSRAELDARADLKDFKSSNRLRHHMDYVPALKLFDPIINLPAGKFLLVDSDVLFFEEPALLTKLIAEETGPKFYFNIEPRGTINSGLAVIDTTAFDLHDIERCLDKAALDAWTIEQDAYTRLAQSRFAPLPREYAVQPTCDDEHSRLTSCHYIGVCRHQFYMQGIIRLRRMGFLGLECPLIERSSRGQP